MTCCCTYKCEQGRDCPVRKQSIEAVNRAYVERGMVTDPNPYEETLGSFSELVAVIILAASVWLLFFVIWWKL